MAKDLDDAEFWLPSEFLTDNDLLTDFGFTEKRSSEFGNVSGNSSGFNSDLSSPVESVMGSTETESDEDDFITGLTRKVANTTLQDSCFSSVNPAKGVKLSGSPQSTLYQWKTGSSRGSPNCVSRGSSPPGAREAVGSWDLLYAAAEEVARMRMIKEFYANKPVAPAHCPVAAPLKNPNSRSGFYPNPAQTRVSYQRQQFEATQIHAQQLKKQQEMMMNGVWGGRRNMIAARGPSMAAWPTLEQAQNPQPQAGSGMRAIFLEQTGARKERTGTGVFLPRRFGTNPPTETRKKQQGAGCPVLLPERVVHALNLNLDSIDSQSHHINSGNFSAEFDAAALKHRNNIAMAQQMKNLRSQQQVMMMNQELRLPQEWTY